MKRFIEGEDRQQVALLPECLDDYIGEDNPVRVVDVFVEELDLQALGFKGADPAAAGRPAYHPAVLLKLYIYGYLNRIQSSRRLEREAQRNVELMWLTGRLAPDFKTIADFRHDNGAGIRNVCKRFVGMCRELKLFTQAIVAIDGSKFKAVNSRDRNVTPAKIDARQRQIEQSIQRYLDALETADRTQPAEVEAKTERLQDKIKRLREQMRQLEETDAFGEGFLYFSIFVGPTGFENYLGPEFGFPFGSPFLAAPLQNEISNLPLRSHRLALTEELDIQVTCTRLPGELNTPVTSTGPTELRMTML